MRGKMKCIRCKTGRRWRNMYCKPCFRFLAGQSPTGPEAK